MVEEDDAAHAWQLCAAPNPTGRAASLSDTADSQKVLYLKNVMTLSI